MKDSVFNAARYDLFIGTLDFSLTKRWRRLLWEEVHGPRVLDAGAGTGLNFSYCQPDFLVTALDNNEHFLKRACQRARRKPQIIKFVVGNIEKLPFQDSHCF